MVEIIKACGENGVCTLEFGDLMVDFSNNREETVELIPLSDPILDPLNEMKHNEEDTKQSAEALEDIMEELKLTDPVAFEDIQLNGDILHD